jgi:alpha-L-fucosidase 2
MQNQKIIFHRRQLLLPLFAIAICATVSRARASDAPDIDLKTAISRGDLDYTNPAIRSEEGMPVGNGRMGSLVWTTPSALKFQINRDDVFGEDGSSVSFPQQDSDYASGCGYVDINVVSAGADVFTAPNFNQHLSIYDGIMTAKGAGLTARALAWNAHDVMAVEINDQRKRPEPINIDLRMLRYALQYFGGMNWQLTSNHAVIYKTANHYATSQLRIRDGAILLTQRFSENKFFDSSAIAISVAGRDSKARFLNESTAQLSSASGTGKFTILISSAATFDRNQDAGDLALAELNAAKAKGNFAALASDNAKWWHDFWGKGYVAAQSGDGQADFVGANYLYFIYLMNSSSRGNYPPRFGGMLWYTSGDMRRWGSEYWHANTDAYYRDLMPSAHLELMDPFFSMYHGMHDAAALAAQQQWDSKGIYIPEVTFFSGPERIPDDLVKEFQDLFLARKPYSEASSNFLAYAQTKNNLNSRYNFLNFGDYVNGVYVAPTKGAGIFGHCTHFLSGMSGIASEFWQRYEFSGDKEWLRAEAYPMIKGVAEFYANFPNLKKESDGKYHIYHVNNIESDWDSQDTPSELRAMSTVFPLAIRASQILGVDEDLRPKWRDIADNPAEPAKGSGNRGNFDDTKVSFAHQATTEAEAASGIILPPHNNSDSGSAGRRPSVQQTNAPSGKSSQAEAIQTSRKDRSMPIAGANADAAGRRRDGGFRRDRIFGNFVGQGDGAIAPLGSEPELKRRFLGFDMTGGFIDATGDGGAEIFRNRLRLREGPGAIDAEHLGGLAFGIHQSLLASAIGDDVTNCTIQVFPAWPKDWTVNFKLLARGGTVVTAAQKDGKVSAVKLEPTIAGTISLKNPWGDTPVKVTRGKTTGTLNGETLTFVTQPGEVIRINP